MRTHARTVNQRLVGGQGWKEADSCQEHDVALFVGCVARAIYANFAYACVCLSARFIYHIAAEYLFRLSVSAYFLFTSFTQLQILF